MSGNNGGGKSPGRRGGQGDQLEAIDYLSSNLGSLAQVAWRHRLDTLGYLIDMAKMEADEALKSIRSG